MSYATYLRLSLAESRACGFPFDSAWNYALEQDRPPLELGVPFPVKFARAAFREGYYGRDVLGSAGIIGEDYDDESARCLEHGSLVA